jgi:hypothetical protein
MGLAILNGTVTYIEADGEEKVETMSGAISFDLRQEADIQEVGSGTFSVNFGSITLANCIIIEQLLGTSEVLLDGEVAGHDELVDGTFCFFDCECSQLDLKHTTDIKAKVLILGNL